MALSNLKQRSISVVTLFILKEGQDPLEFNWQTGGYLVFGVYEGSNAWCGRLEREEHRKDWPNDGLQSDLSKFDQLVQLLCSVPKDKIYPVFPSGELTQYQPQQGGDSEVIYLKAPKLNHYRDGSDELAVRLLNEAKINERILRNPHRNLGSYLGCIVEEGRIVRLALKRYSKTLNDRFEEISEEFTTQQKMDCMDQIEAAAVYLHSLGLAHNDISPLNIMFDNTGQAILIDFDACAPLGETLTKGGLVTGWKGPIAGEGRQYDQSSAELDKQAIQEIRNYLTDKRE